MKKQLLLPAVLCLSQVAFGQKVHQLASPNGNIRISVELTDQIRYDVTHGNQTLPQRPMDGELLRTRGTRSCQTPPLRSL
ncbi:hypothetical protein [uncultured Bacteroides sp.]|uniref:hypothetical protein n=1 Tax=uncultured Bacteroides sp. TaxID=162156 RepID=UPI0025D535EF|nr:hypothetical protein [uncultured Bacteroides sp.]